MPSESVWPPVIGHSKWSEELGLSPRRTTVWWRDCLIVEKWLASLRQSTFRATTLENILEFVPWRQAPPNLAWDLCPRFVPKSAHPRTLALARGYQ